MPRTKFTFTFSNFEKAESMITQILTSKGFQQKIINSELIWKKGGALMGGQCLKIDYSDNHIDVFGWLTPSLGSNQEFALTGLTGVIPRKQLLGTIEQIKLAIM
ncbi:MAG: hypothetical protein IJW79_08930 [Clostridia bacterium]|nr:hypothetical protein [Clostridia bacterium]